MEHRILLVDDDPGAREALSSILADEGFQVTCAADGQEALEHLRSEPPPCLILLDLTMPVMDGWEFRSAQKKDPALASIPVVVLTANKLSDETETAIDGADIVPKPIDFDVLLSAVQRHC
jgi:CheY-like chemotaxis protein